MTKPRPEPLTEDHARDMEQKMLESIQADLDATQDPAYFMLVHAVHVDRILPKVSVWYETFIRTPTAPPSGRESPRPDESA